MTINIEIISLDFLFCFQQTIFQCPEELGIYFSFFLKLKVGKRNNNIIPIMEKVEKTIFLKCGSDSRNYVLLETTDAWCAELGRLLIISLTVKDTIQNLIAFPEEGTSLNSTQECISGIMFDSLW